MTEEDSKGLEVKDVAEAVGTCDVALPDDRIYYVDRLTGELEREVVLGEGWLRFLYGGGLLGSLFLWVLRRRPMNILYGLIQRRTVGTRRVRRFAESLAIDLGECQRPLSEYRTIDDFFTRSLKEGARPFVEDPVVLPSPADARALVFPELAAERLPVKGGGYTLAELICDPALAESYVGGSVCVLRLAPPDYHRFHFPDGGAAGSARAIPGLLDSVSPYALRRLPDLFCRNQRELTVIETDGFGPMLFLEVGAMLVGTICQTFSPGRVERGQEKGFFRFGGSTIVLAFERNRIRFSDDLLRCSERGIEIKLLCGTPLGTVGE
ncbi:phosphatidylserine decarboxylase [Planctomycetota bacterium]